MQTSTPTRPDATSRVFSRPSGYRVPGNSGARSLRVHEESADREEESTSFPRDGDSAFFSRRRDGLATNVQHLRPRRDDAGVTVNSIFRLAFSSLVCASDEINRAIIEAILFTHVFLRPLHRSRATIEWRIIHRIVDGCLRP